MRVRRYYCQSVRRSAALLCDRIGRGKGSARPLLWRRKRTTAGIAQLRIARPRRTLISLDNQAQLRILPH